MLELREYTKPEMTEMFGTKDNQGLKRKLEGYAVDFEITGRGESAIYKIKSISFAFKLFCITEFGCDGNTDFIKLRNFYYYFFNDEEFSAMPDEVKEARMRLEHKDISRQTIANYTKKLEEKNMIHKTTTEFIYYFAYKDTQRIVERSEYSQAWKEYWDNKKNYGMCSMEAIEIMRYNYGGVARKQAIPERNSLLNDKIEHMLDLIQQSFEEGIQSIY